MSEYIGVAIALLSSCLGGTAAAITRYLVSSADPIALAILRWGIGFVCLLPVTLLLRAKWPESVATGLRWRFSAFASSAYSSSSIISRCRSRLRRAPRSRGDAAALTMVVGALLGIEPLTFRKTIGVCIAVFGVGAVLASGLSAAPPGAWRGELMMLAAVVCMAFYNVLSRPLMQRSSALGFLTVGMGTGAAALIIVGLFTGSNAALKSLSTPQWIAGVYLGVGGGAAAFILWVLALERATPTRVANTMTVNPIAAGLLATQLVGEPITPNLVLGLVAVFAGIWIATSEIKKS